MENVSLTNETHQPSSRKSKVKRLPDNVPSNLPVIHVPPMSETSLKRWCDARDAYLGGPCPYVEKQRPTRPKPKTRKKYQSSIGVVPSVAHRFVKIDRPVQEEQQQQQQPNESQVTHEHVDDKCVGTENNGLVLFEPTVEQTDEAIQADLPSPEDTTEQEQAEEFKEDYIEYNDQSTETDFILDIIKENKPISREVSEQDNTVDRQIIKEDDTDRQKIKQDDVADQTIKQDDIDRQTTKDDETGRPSIKEINLDSIPNVDNEIEVIHEDDTKTILSSDPSNNSMSEQLRRLRHRFKQLSKERRLLSCLLFIYLMIMLALLIIIFLLLRAYQGRALIFTREGKMSSTGFIDGIARYGESCKNNNDCKRPFTCFKKTPTSSSGICRCPLNYNFVNNQCIGDLNALCKKDTDCQRYMLCSGMEDGTRRCHCQTLYNYDADRQQCRGDYNAPCQSHFDCQANLICNTTIVPSLCSCQSNYRYYPLVHKCRGDAGAICEQKTAECTDNAECRDGACECAYQFIPNNKKICVDPCPKTAITRVKIRYPGDCRRFIDCQKRTKSECPDTTIFNFRTQLCDYPKNVLDCR